MVYCVKGVVDFDIFCFWSVWFVLGVIGGVIIVNNISVNGLIVVFVVGVFFYLVYFLFLEFVVRLGLVFFMFKGIGKVILVFVFGGFFVLLGIGGGIFIVIIMVMC